MKAIVTGHSRGLGAAIADALLARGIPVLGLARQRHAGLAQAYPALFADTNLDLADAAALAAWLDSGALARFAAGASTLLLVNNAGTVQPVGPAGLQGAGNVARAIGLNVAAPLMLADAVAALPCAEKRILHVSSGAARNAYPGWSVYCATKAALDMHARATELDRIAGVKVCSLAPGVIDTDMQAEIRSAGVDRFPLRERFEAMKRDGALATPENCAGRLVGYLLGEAFGAAAVADLREVAPA